MVCRVATEQAGSPSPGQRHMGLLASSSEVVACPLCVSDQWLPFAAPGPSDSGFCGASVSQQCLRGEQSHGYRFIGMFSNM